MSQLYICYTLTIKCVWKDYYGLHAARADFQFLPRDAAAVSEVATSRALGNGRKHAPYGSINTFIKLAVTSWIATCVISSVVGAPVLCFRLRICILYSEPPTIWQL